MNTTTKIDNWLTEGRKEEELKSEEILAIVSGRIQLRRIEMGLDQKQFAKLLGVTQGMVSRWESGTYNFTISTLVNICEKLGLSFDPQITTKEVEVFATENAPSIVFDFSNIKYHSNRNEEFGSWQPKREKTQAGAAA